MLFSPVTEAGQMYTVSLSSNALKVLFILLRHQGQMYSRLFFIPFDTAVLISSSELPIKLDNYYVWIRFFFILHVQVLKWSRNSMTSSKEWLERGSLVKVKFLNMASKNFQIKFQIQFSVIRRGRNTLLDLRNSS